MQVHDLSIEMMILLMSLATWRLASLLAHEDGPFDLFPRLRRWAGVQVDAIGQVYPTNTFAKGLLCVWCNSIWVGVGMVVAFYIVPIVAFWLVLPLALSALAVGYMTVLDYLRRVDQ